MCKCTPDLMMPFCGKQGCEWPFQRAPVQLVLESDHVAEKLDEMADLCEFWKKNRVKGRTPFAIRTALLELAGELHALGAIAQDQRLAYGSLGPSTQQG